MTHMEQIKDEIIVRAIGALDSVLMPHEVERTVSNILGVPLSAVKDAVKDLVEEGELAYVYLHPYNYLRIPPVRRHHAARPMDVVFDSDGEPWICDAGADPSGDLARQGCWRCGDLAFTRND